MYIIYDLVVFSECMWSVQFFSTFLSKFFILRIRKTNAKLYGNSKSYNELRYFEQNMNAYLVL